MKKESENKDVKLESRQDDNPSNESSILDNPKEDKSLSLEEKLLKTEEELYSWKNKYAMMFADMDNLRKSQDKSFSEALRYRAEGFIDKLIPALDAFHIALKNPVEDPKLKNYLVGFDFIYKQIQQALEDEGVKEIPIKVGDPFDVRTMHALETEVHEGPPNRVVKILSAGYRLHDRVVKQVLVVVSKLADPAVQPSSEPTKESDAVVNSSNNSHNGNKAE